MSEIKKDLIVEDWVSLDEMNVIETNPILEGFARQPSYLPTLLEKLRQLPNVTVYRKQDIPDKWHYRDNPRIPEIIVVPDEHVNIVCISQALEFSAPAHKYKLECK